jgi:hypothetical protein
MDIKVLNWEPGNIYSLNPEEEKRKERGGGGEENKTNRKTERRTALPSVICPASLRKGGDQSPVDCRGISLRYIRQAYTYSHLPMFVRLQSNYLII